MELIAIHSHRLWICHQFLCSIFSKILQQFDFITQHKFVIRNVIYKVKDISQINGGLLMFFGNL